MNFSINLSQRIGTSLRRNQAGRTRLADDGVVSFLTSFVEKPKDWANIRMGNQSPLLVIIAGNGYLRSTEFLLSQFEVGCELDPLATDLNGANSLLWAARNGHEDIVDLLITCFEKKLSLSEMKLFLTQTDKTGETPLLEAAAHNKPKLFETILNALRRVYQGDPEGLKESLLHKNNHERDVVLIAAQKGNYAALKQQKEALEQVFGTDRNGLRKALKRGNKVYNSAFDVAYALSNGNPYLYSSNVDFLREGPSDPLSQNFYKSHILHRLADQGNLQEFRIVLGKGLFLFPKTEFNDFVNFQDKREFSPLMAAVMSDHPNAEIINLLLCAGASPSCRWKSREKLEKPVLYWAMDKARKEQDPEKKNERAWILVSLLKHPMTGKAEIPALNWKEEGYPDFMEGAAGRKFQEYWLRSVDRDYAGRYRDTANTVLGELGKIFETRSVVHSSPNPR